jgi:hypothetical protein
MRFLGFKILCEAQIFDFITTPFGVAHPGAGKK